MILNNEMATNAFSAFNSLPIITYTANVARETCKKHKRAFHFCETVPFEKLQLINVNILLPMNMYIKLS